MPRILSRSRGRLASFACLLATSLVMGPVGAQTAPCESRNASNTNVSNAITLYNLAGPNTWAWRLTNGSSARVLRGVRLMTAHSRGAFMILEIFDHDSQRQQPGQRLGGGTFRVPASTTADWHGASLDATVLVKPAQDIWIVWTEGGGSVLPVEPLGRALQDAKTKTNSGWATNGNLNLKVQLFCSLLDTQGTQVAGNGCAGAFGDLAVAFNNAPPSVGNTSFGIQGSGFPSGAPALFVLGVTPNFPSIPLQGTNSCSLHTDILMIFAGVTGTGGVRSSSAAGHVELPVPIPNDAKLRGLYFGMQIAVYEQSSSQALPLVFTNGVRTTVF